MNPLSLLTNWQTNLALLGVGLVLGFGSGWTVHGWEQHAHELHDVKKAATIVLAAEHKQTAQTAVIDTSHAKTQAKIRETFGSLQRKVPTYVPQAVDDRFPIAAGLVRIHDAAALGADLPLVPDAAGGPDDQTSDVKTSQLAAAIVGNYETCTSIRQQLISLQGWVSTMQTGIIPKEAKMDWQEMLMVPGTEMVAGTMYRDHVELGRLEDGQFVLSATAPVVEPLVLPEEPVVVAKAPKAPKAAPEPAPEPDPAPAVVAETEASVADLLGG